MTPEAWIGLAGVVTAIFTTLLTLITKAAWNISGTVKTIEDDVKVVGLEVKSVSTRVTSCENKIDSVAESVSSHINDCDSEREQFRNKLDKLGTQNP